MPQTSVATTPTASSQSAVLACTNDQLTAEFVRSGVAAGSHYPTYAIANSGPGDCTLPGPPEIVFYDEAGAEIPAIVRLGPTECEPLTLCVEEGEFELEAGGGPSYPESVGVTLRIANPANLEPCSSPNAAAYTLGFVFPEPAATVQIELDGEQISPCHDHVTQVAFGDWFDGTAENGTIAWEDAVDLIQACQVTSVMQAHSQDVYIMLSDGTEIVTREPEIDDIFAIAQSAMAACGSQISIGTE